MDKEPLHVRLRAAAFAARTNGRLSALLLEAAAAVPKPKGGEEPRRDTMAVLAAHHAAAAADPREAEDAARAYREGPGAPVVAAYRAATMNPAGDVISPRTFRAPEPPGAFERLIAAGPPATDGDMAICGHCGEEFRPGVTHCPECSGRVA